MAQIRRTDLTLNIPVEEAYHLSVKTAILCGALCMAILIFGAHPLISLFLQNGSPAYDYAIYGLPLFASSAIFFALNIDIIGYFQSVEDNLRATIYMLLRGLVLLVPSFILLPKALSTTGMWLAVPLSEGLTLGVILLTRGRKKR